ncbi:MAG: DUF885 domain-containing protein [Bacteroidota bacterium]
MRITGFLLIYLILISCREPSFDNLLQNYHEDYLKLYPLAATSAGDNRYNQILPNNISVEYRNELKNFYRDYSEKLKAIDRSALSDNDQLSYDLLLYQCSINLEGLKFNDHLMPISQIQSMPLQVAQLAAGTGNQPFKTVRDYDNWLLRLDGFVAWCDTAIVNMKKGMATGYVIPKALAQKVVPQIASFDHGPVKEHHYYKPILDMPSDFSADDKSRLEKAYLDVIHKKIIPIHQKLRAFFEQEYIPACRETSGIDAIPGGKQFYNYLVRKFTTTDLTADSIFALGKSEVDWISKHLDSVQNLLPFGHENLHPFKTGDDIIAYYNAIHEKMKPNLAMLFNKTPKTGFEVRRIEAFREKTTAANYVAGSEDGKRPGIFYFPSPEPENYSIVGTEDLFLHEAIPGHHYQIMLKIENKSLPMFRRYLNYGSYTEGWGLYAESLGKELGLYTDPYQYIGMLSAEMHRAIRLVVDAGIHSQGWTREQAIEYSKRYEAASEESIISEIERYMGNPGQALTYKVGQLKILELRTRAEQVLGERFNIKEFHHAVLNQGSLPLHMLDKRIDFWMNSY